jgi:hypothetical protein
MCPNPDVETVISETSNGPFSLTGKSFKPFPEYLTEDEDESFSGARRVTGDVV